MSAKADDSAALGHHPFGSKMLFLLSLCAFASMASMRVCDAMLPALATQFSTTPGQAARAISGFALAYGLLQLIYGPLGDRHGKARVISYATLACTVGCIAAAMSPSLNWLIASRVLMGTAAAGIIPLTMAWIGDSVAYEQRQEVLARLLGATVFGMICGQWFGGILSDVFGWRSAFAVLAVMFLVCGSFLAVDVRAASPARPAPGAARIADGVLEVVRGPWARVVLIVACLEGALAFSALAFIPAHLQATFQVTAAAAGGIVAMYGVGGLLYSRCARPLLLRLGEAGLARLGGTCLGLAFVAIAFAPSWGWVVPACLVAGFGFYALHNTLQTHATQMAPAARGTAVSLFACALFLGQSLGIQFASGAFDRFSSTVVFVGSALGLFLLGGVFASLIGSRQKPRREGA